MHRGWTKRWRKRWDKELHKEFLAWIMLDYFIDFAAYEKTTREIHGAGVIDLERGEWAFTERELSEFFGVDRQRIRTTIKFLANPNIPNSNPMINPTTNPKFTKIKVINYDTYQDKENKLTQSLTQSLTQRVPKSNPKQVSTIIKEIKNTTKINSANLNGSENAVYDFYIEKISPENKSGARARINIKSHLKHHSIEDLKQSVLNYSTMALKSEPRFRKDPANFFGKSEPYFKDFLPGTFQAPKSQAVSYNSPEKDREKWGMN